MTNGRKSHFHHCNMASNVEQRLLALEQGLLRVASLEQSHAQIAQLHEMVQNLAKKISSDEENPKKKSQGASELAGGEAPSSSSSRSKKTGKVPKARRDGTPKPSSSSGEGGHGKSDSLFMQFARLERDGWNQEAVVADLQRAPKIELNHKAVLGRLAYELKQRQLSSGRPQKNTFVTSTLDMVQKLGEEKDRNRNKLLVRRACVAYGAWIQASKDPK